jgi:DNA-directed RNA polymerase specialized sigma24 family protein
MVRTIESNREQHLITAVARGDRVAFRQLYDATYGKVGRYIRCLVNDDLLAEDILVQTYAVVWQSFAADAVKSHLTNHAKARITPVTSGLNSGIETRS